MNRSGGAAVGTTGAADPPQATDSGAAASHQRRQQDGAAVGKTADPHHGATAGAAGTSGQTHAKKARHLPKTASPVPLMLLLAFGAFAGAGALRFARQQ